MNQKKKNKYGPAPQEPQYDYSILNWRRLPARLTSEQVAVLLHCTRDEVSALVRQEVLFPLGRPINNCVKFFHGPTLELAMGDEEFCAEVSDAIYGKNRKHNDRKNIIPFDEEEEDAA